MARPAPATDPHALHPHPACTPQLVHCVRLATPATLCVPDALSPLLPPTFVTITCLPAALHPSPSCCSGQAGVRYCIVLLRLHHLVYQWIVPDERWQPGGLLCGRVAHSHHAPAAHRVLAQGPQAHGAAHGLLGQLTAEASRGGVRTLCACSGGGMGGHGKLPGKGSKAAMLSEREGPTAFGGVWGTGELKGAWGHACGCRREARTRSAREVRSDDCYGGDSLQWGGCLLVGTPAAWRCGSYVVGRVNPPGRGAAGCNQDALLCTALACTMQGLAGHEGQGVRCTSRPSALAVASVPPLHAWQHRAMQLMQLL